MLFILNLMAGFWFVYDIVMTELQSGSERREREKRRTESFGRLDPGKKA